MLRRSRRRIGARLALAGVCVASGCLRPEPIVEHRVHEIAHGSLAKVAIVSLYPEPQQPPRAEPQPEPLPERQTQPPLHGTPEAGDAPEQASGGAADAADLVSRFLSEAFEAAGVEVVPASDLVLAFEGEGRVLPRRDVEANARIAAEQFGATAVLLGRLKRYREREGGAAGVQRPASVWFEVDLYSAPAGQHLFSARFDQTQQSFSSNVLLARRYPGGGTRWLTAAELARWGAAHVVESLPEGLR